jgi:lipopolysaccharide transport system ATP-binding protein
MSDIAIRAEGLGKQYRIGKRRVSYGSLRDSVAETFAKPFHAARSLMSRKGNGNSNGNGDLTSDPRPLTSKFWALKDVSFEIKPGEVVGIIGRNGAGKSTLLKILSRITEPTTGAVDIFGRVGSLLEVGTGFHPELTGQENVYLNGAILGLTQTEIDHKLDDIVAFAEIEEFLHTPVKRYSSGMYLRLAFAVAAHLESEILLVDEVLAVGDAAFQKKCLGKMEDVAKAGRTVLFVSHNMAAVAALCSRAYLFDRGEIIAGGECLSTINEYMKSVTQTAGTPLHLRKDRAGSGQARLTEIRLRDEKGILKESFLAGQACHIELCCDVFRFIASARFLIGIYDHLGRQLALLDSYVMRCSLTLKVGQANTVCVLPALPLFPGTYFLNLAIMTGEEVVDHVVQGGELVLDAGDFFGTGKLPEYGPLLIQHSWTQGHQGDSI